MTKLEKRVREKGISMYKLAKGCGISRTMFYETFSGKKDFSHFRLDVAIKTCMILGCKLSDLIEDDDENFEAVKEYEKTMMQSRK